MRVLVVDDEQPILRVCQRALARRHEVTLAHGGRAAVALLTENPARFDVIICDLAMPDFDGVDLHAYVAERFPNLVPRIVFFTGGAYTMRAQVLLERAANPRVDKPFTPADLERAIGEVSRKSE
jgi:CheY-like chemotaxis protein